MRNFIFITILTLLLFGLIELVIGYAYFQKNGKLPLSTMEMADYVSKKTAMARAEAYIQTVKARLGGEGLEWGEISGALAQHLYAKEGEPLLEEFAARYEAEFTRLKETADKAGSKLIVMFIPGVPGKMSRPWCLKFFKDLTQRHNVTYLNLTEPFDKIGHELLSLHPWNGHMSRYGHRIVADELAKIIDPLQDYRSSVSITPKNTNFADALPNLRQIVDIDPEHPYFVKTNRYGFRMEEDFPLDDPRQRIVILGDSIAYGPYVANEDVFTDMLQRRRPDALFLNAAAAGYNIVHEAELFKEKTHFISPDITILQVVENDIYSMYHYKLNEYDRHGRLHDPSPLEAQHIKRVIAKLNAKNAKGEDK